MERFGRAFAAALFVVAVALSSFYFGYNLGRPSTTQAAPNPTATPEVTAEAREYFDVFWEAWSLVEREYYDEQAIDRQKLTYGAIKGMLEALGDPHTSFATPQEARISEEDMRGSFFGIGVQVEERDGKLVVVAPLDGTPAQQAGIRTGDIIASVDGKSLDGVPLREAVALIRGPRGSKVSLTIERAGEAQPLTFELVRSEIRVSVVRSEMLDGNVGYIKLNTFSANAGPDVRNALDALLAQKPTAIVFDLRNNPGGLLQSAVEVTSQFLESGVVLVEEQRDGQSDTFRVESGGVATEIPMVVLVNGGSASASEIVAGALQDHGRAILIGEKTFGKSTVQNVHRLSDRSSVRITFAQWWTPNRQEINGTGLTPDIVVELSDEDRSAGRDPQLDAALKYLRQMVAAGTGQTP